MTIFMYCHGANTPNTPLQEGVQRTYLARLLLRLLRCIVLDAVVVKIGVTHRA